MQDDKYHALTAKLRKEVKSIKKVQEERVRMHEKGLKTDPNYSMNMHKIHHEKMVQQAYMIKDWAVSYYLENFRFLNSLHKMHKIWFSLCTFLLSPFCNILMQ